MRRHVVAIFRLDRPFLSGIARNVNWGLPLPSLLLPFFPYPPCPSPPSFPFPPLPSLPLRPLRGRTPKTQLRGLGEHCELPKRGLGQSPSRNRIWCIITLKYEI